MRGKLSTVDFMQRRKLGFAVPAATGSKVVLLDEPSLGLAPIMVQEIGRLIEEINKEQRLSIVLVEYLAV
jgi:branched-chain amino acid transport system ATP-binding protein